MAKNGWKGTNVDSGSGSKSGAKDSESVGKVDKVEKSSGTSGGGEGRQHDVEFAKGGDTKMFGEQAAGPQKEGTTAHDVSGGAPGADFAKGGSGKMFGFSGALPARAGITSAR
jgi:hypothetical protein